MESLSYDVDEVDDLIRLFGFLGPNNSAIHDLKLSNISNFAGEHTRTRPHSLMSRPTI